MRHLRQGIEAIFGAMGSPVLTAIVYGGCAALAVPLSREGGYGGAVIGAFAYSLALLFLACLLIRGATAFAADARSLCLPGARALLSRARLLTGLVLAGAVTISGWALASNPVWPAWMATLLVLGVGMAGVLFPLNRAISITLLVVVPLVAYWRAPRPEGTGGPESALGLALYAISAALALAAAMKWSQLTLRTARRAAGGLAARSVLRAPASEPVIDPSERSHAPSGDPRKAASAVRLIRTCLGGPFLIDVLSRGASSSERRTVLMMALVLLTCGIAVELPWPGEAGWYWGTGLTIILAAGVLSGYLLRIARACRAISGELAELALIPGLGDGRAQRAALYRAALAPPIFWLGGLYVVGSVVTLWKGAPLRSAGELAIWLAAVWLIYVGHVLRAFAAHAPASKLAMSLQVFVVAVYAPLALGARWPLAAWVAPIALFGGMSVVVYISARKLAAAPHPFLA